MARNTLIRRHPAAGTGIDDTQDLADPRNERLADRTTNPQPVPGPADSGRPTPVRCHPVPGSADAVPQWRSWLVAH
jgi:hypothetical protein